MFGNASSTQIAKSLINCQLASLAKGTLVAFMTKETVLEALSFNLKKEVE